MKQPDQPGDQQPPTALVGDYEAGLYRTAESVALVTGGYVFIEEDTTTGLVSITRLPSAEQARAGRPIYRLMHTYEPIEERLPEVTVPDVEVGFRGPFLRGFTHPGISTAEC